MIVPGTEETATRKAVEEIVPREGHAAEEAS